jgi:hypothetical protein
LRLRDVPRRKIHYSSSRDSMPENVQLCESMFAGKLARAPLIAAIDEQPVTMKDHSRTG